jgi:hypothetical protein
VSRLFLGASVALGTYVTVAAAVALDFEPMSLDRLIRSADLVVVGSVESASEDRFTLRVSDLIAAPHISKTVTIKRNKDWSGDQGPGLYREGQGMLVFAEKTKPDVAAKSPPWRVLGFESEGVLPSDGEHVYYTGGALEGFEAETYDLDGVRLTGYRFELSDFIDAVTADRACFGHAPARNEAAPEQSEVLCSESELVAFRDNTTLGPYLIRQARGE